MITNETCRWKVIQENLPPSNSALPNEKLMSIRKVFRVDSLSGSSFIQVTWTTCSEKSLWWTHSKYLPLLCSSIMKTRGSFLELSLIIKINTCFCIRFETQFNQYIHRQFNPCSSYVNDSWEESEIIMTNDDALFIFVTLIEPYF